MYRPSKKAGEEYHPRRQLMVTGDKAFSLFLKWPQYLTLREELLQENGAFKDPGRTTFLSTRCGCFGGSGRGFLLCVVPVQGERGGSRILSIAVFLSKAMEF